MLSKTRITQESGLENSKYKKILIQKHCLSDTNINKKRSCCLANNIAVCTADRFIFYSLWVGVIIDEWLASDVAKH